MNFRLFVMPIVVTFFAVRAGLRDAKEGQPSFLWGLLTDPVERRKRLASGWKDISRIFLVAIVLDITYQLMVLRALYPGQVLIVAVTCAVVPYVLFRGTATLLSRFFFNKQTAKTKHCSQSKLS